MANGFFKVPEPRNEPVLDYAPGSLERKTLERQLDRMSSRVIEIPARIGGRKIRTGRLAEAVMPHNHAHVLGQWHKCRKVEVERARPVPHLLTAIAAPIAFDGQEVVE